VGIHRRVTLLLAVRLPDGNRTYLPAAFQRNGRVKPFAAMYKKREELFHGASYYLRWYVPSDNGKQKQKWACVGPDPEAAFTARQNKEDELAGGMTNAAPVQSAQTLKVQVDEYLKGLLNKGKSHKTYVGYKQHLNLFLAFCPRPLMSMVTEKDLEAFCGWLRDNYGHTNATIFNVFQSLNAFWRKHKMLLPLDRKDWPKPGKKVVEPYDPEELLQLFNACDFETRVAFMFFLGTGCREQETSNAWWRDINFRTKTLTVRFKPAWSPKDKAERVIPLNSSLVEVLKVWRERNPEAQRVFSSKEGGLEGHFLRRLKEVSHAARLNCGQCVNKVGQSCAEHPVCQKFTLHKFRKTFATHLVAQGVSLEKVQMWLGHADLQTTKSYVLREGEATSHERDVVDLVNSKLYRMPEPDLAVA
jgi:integrase/recombinase XerD